MENKRFKWPAYQKPNHSDPPYYYAVRPTNNNSSGGGGEYYHQHPNKSYSRPNHSHNHNKHPNPGGSSNYYYKPPHARSSGGAAPPPEVSNAGTNTSSSSDVVTLIVENNNLKRMIVLNLNLTQELTDSLAAKDKEMDEQHNKITQLQENNQELGEQNAKLSETIEDLRRQLRRHIKRVANDNDESPLPPPSSVKVLRNVETQTTVPLSLATLPVPHQHQSQIKSTSLQLRPPDQQKAQLTQEKQPQQHQAKKIQKLVTSVTEIPAPVVTKADQQQVQLIQEKHHQYQAKPQQKLVTSVTEIAAAFIANANQQPSQLIQEKPLHQSKTQQKLVTSVTKLPAAVVTNSADSKARGDFNGGKKYSILNRVNQDSSLTSTHSVQETLKEVVEEEFYHDTLTIEQNDMDVATETTIGAEEEVSECEVQLEEEQDLEQEQVDPVEVNLNNGHMEQYQLSGETDIEVAIPMTYDDAVVHQLEPTIEDQDHQHVVSGSALHEALGLTPNVTSNEVEAETIPVLWQPKTKEAVELLAKEPQVFHIDPATATTLANSVVNDVDVKQKNSIVPSAHSTPNKQKSIHKQKNATAKQQKEEITENEQVCLEEQNEEANKRNAQVCVTEAEQQINVETVDIYMEGASYLDESMEIEVHSEEVVIETTLTTDNEQRDHNELPEKSKVSLQPLKKAQQPTGAAKAITHVELSSEPSVPQHQPAEPTKKHVLAGPLSSNLYQPASESNKIDVHSKEATNESTYTNENKEREIKETLAHLESKLNTIKKQTVAKAITHKANHQAVKPNQQQAAPNAKHSLAGPLSSKLKTQVQKINKVTTVVKKPLNPAKISDKKATLNKMPPTHQLLKKELDAKQKLRKHIQKQLQQQLQQLPVVQLKKIPVQNSNLIFPPKPVASTTTTTSIQITAATTAAVAAAAPITPAPTPTTTPSSTPTSSASPQRKTDNPTVAKSKPESAEVKQPVTSLQTQAPLTPQSISSVSSTTSNSRRTVNSYTPHAYTKTQPTSGFLSTSYLYTTRAWEDQEFHCDLEFFLEEADELLSDNPRLEIPQWKVVQLEPTKDDKEVESLTDEDFIKRHDKYVRDEIDRKRRDARYIRDQIRSEELRKRHNQDEVLVPLDPLPMSTFYPLPEDIDGINYVSDVPVQAFGENMVTLQSDDFNLPWLEAAHATTVIAAAKARAAPVATLASKKLPTTAAEARHQEMNSSFVFLKRRKRQRRQQR